MRRAALPALMISLALLSGCTGAGKWENKLSERRKELSEAERVSFTAEISADLGDKVFDCTLLCEKSGDETVMTVAEPELAAGVTARISADDTVLSFDGVELSVGALPEGGVSPFASVPIFMDALTGDYAFNFNEETTESGMDTVCAESYVSDGQSALIWYDAQTLIPVHGQIVSGGRVCIRCDISDFTSESGTDEAEHDADMGGDRS